MCICKIFIKCKKKKIGNIWIKTSLKKQQLLSCIKGSSITFGSVPERHCEAFFNYRKNSILK